MAVEPVTSEICCSCECPLSDKTVRRSAAIDAAELHRAGFSFLAFVKIGYRVDSILVKKVAWVSTLSS